MNDSQIYLLNQEEWHQESINLHICFIRPPPFKHGQRSITSKPSNRVAVWLETRPLIRWHYSKPRTQCLCLW